MPYSCHAYWRRETRAFCSTLRQHFASTWVVLPNFMVHDGHEAPESLNADDVPAKDLLPALRPRKLSPVLLILDRMCLVGWDLVHVAEGEGEGEVVHMQPFCLPA